MTEPEAGSAVTDLKTTAKPDGAGFRVNGEKVFTTHAQYADVMVAYVRFGPGVGGIGSVLIERNAPGVQPGQALALHERRGMGHHSASTTSTCRRRTCC